MAAAADMLFQPASTLPDRAAPAPAIIFLPDIDEWWATVKPHMRSQLKSLLAELPKDFPLLILATASSAEEKLDDEVRQLFCSFRAPVGGSVSIVELTVGKVDQRRATVRVSAAPEV